MVNSSDKGQMAVKQNVRAVMTFLRGYAPFRDMDEPNLARLVEQCSLQYFADGDIVLDPAGERVEHLYIVKQGRIRGERDTNHDGQIDTTFEIAEGECFPMAALLGERSTRTRHRAIGDTFCLVLSREAFVEIFGLSESFRDFCLRGVSSLLDQVTRDMQSRSIESLGANQSLDAPLERFCGRSPLVCDPDTPIRQAVTRMHHENVGSMVVVDTQRQPIGIFTLRDLRALIADGRQELDVPIDAVMTPEPYALEKTATAFDAALLMAEHHFAHVCVVDEAGLICGVVSERDLFSLQRVDLVHLARTIATARNLKTLVGLRADVAKLVDTMLAHGAATGQILRIVTTLNDCTVRRVIELNLSRHDPGIPFTWLTFGSEARHEQTLVTDQDNGILFQCPRGSNPDAIREQLLPLARQINEDLAECGFSWCKGNIMASNPQLCLSADEWRRWYESFIDAATPENLLKSSIFLDMRPIWGADTVAEEMFEAVRRQVRDNTLFQKMLADNALHFRPPLTLFRGFVFVRGEKNTIDLKTQGLTPFVDAARIFAFAHGVQANSTLERIRGLAEKGAFDSMDAKAWVESYELIQLLRMHSQQDQVRAGKPPNNRINTSDLNQLDRRILREAFRQAQRLQQKLERAYPG